MKHLREITEPQEPKKTVTAYKLFNKKGNNLHPLFIGKNKPTPQGKWIHAEHIPTSGFAERPGWHAGHLPMAPHLRTKQNKIAPNRVWAEVHMPADVDHQSEANKSKTKDIRGKVPVGGHYRFETSKMQGGAWMIGGAIKINKVLSDQDVHHILTKNGISPEEAKREQHGD